MSFNDWNQETIKGGGDSGSKYLKLKQKGDTADIRIASPTFVRLTAYDKDSGSYADTEYVNSISPMQFQEEFGDNESYQTRVEYIWVVYVRAFNGEEVNEAQVYAAPPSIREDMLKFAKNSKWGDPSMYDFEVKRLKQNITDAGDDFYSVTPDPTKSKLKKEEQEKVDALLKDIEKMMPGVQTLEAFTGKKHIASALGGDVTVENLTDEEEAMLK